MSTYQAGIGVDGGVYIGWNEGSGTFHELGITYTDLRPNQEDVFLRFDVVGNDLRMYAWGDGDPEPLEPTVHVSDGRLSGPGTVSVMNDPDGSNPTSTRFRFIEVSPIPEPSGLALCVVGVWLTRARWTVRGQTPTRCIE